MHGTIELASLTDLGGDLENLRIDGSGEGLGVGDELGLLVRALTEGLRVLLLDGLGGHGGEALRHEIIHRITGLDLDDLTSVAEIGHI